MAAQKDLQELLRFLTADAKVPLAQAMSKISVLRAKGLQKKEDIAAASLETVQSIFEDEKQAKQILQAAKRVSRKRGAAGDAAGTSPSTKRKKTLDEAGAAPTPEELENSLALPDPVKDVQLLNKTTLIANRAPLSLAFATTVLKFTTNQPLSSRLSIAQAVVSANSRSKAVSLGIEKGKPAEDEGWGQGQPYMMVMGRKVHVLRRVETPVDPDSADTAGDTSAAQAVWALDLEAMRTSSIASRDKIQTGSSMPIHTPQSARAYLLKSFASSQPAGGSDDKVKEKKKTAAQLAEEKKHNLALVLGALELLFESWSNLSTEELDRRAWGWYVAVRPDVQTGVSGWAEKNAISLANILELRRPSVLEQEKKGQEG